MKCKGCEFCMVDSNGDRVCGDVNYGQVITESVNDHKQCYSEGLYDFIKRMQKLEKKNKALHDKIIYG